MFPTCQTAANADDSLWSAGRTSSYSTKIKTSLQRGFDVRGCEGYSHPYATDLKVLTKLMIRSMQATRKWYKKTFYFNSVRAIWKCSKWNWSHALCPSRHPEGQNHASLSGRDCLQLPLTATWGNPESQTAPASSSRRGATPGSRCQSVWPGHQS